MKCLLVGAGGMLAGELTARMPRDVQLLRRTHAELDVTDAGAVRAAVAADSPDYILNCSSFNAVDAAETEVERATAVNVTGPANLADAAAARGIRVLHISTDFVFDGQSRRPYREDDPTGPINAYGRGKLEGERRVLSAGARALVVRTQWLFGFASHAFALRMLQRALKREQTAVVDDQTGRPTSAADLAEALWKLVTGGAEGIYHVANRGIGTRYDEARVIFEKVGAADVLRPCHTADYPVAAQRPRYTVLDTTKSERFLAKSLPEWRDSLDVFLEDAIAKLRR